MSGLTHPAIREAVQTCSACPEQWEGTLVDGRHFYFRYRGGSAGLGIGADSEAATRAWHARRKADLRYGGSLQGAFDSAGERNLVFASLFTDADPLATIRQAAEEYTAALRRREHGDIAASRLADQVLAALGIDWRA